MTEPRADDRSPFDWAEPLPDDQVERALVVAAHPDDADFGCSGTVAGWVDAGIEVTLVLCTRGDQGGFDDTERAEMPRIREAEQRAASAELGVTDVRFLDGFHDGWLEPNWELQKQLVTVIRQVRPQRVLCQSPDRNLRRLQGSHPDHLAAGEATVRAVYPAAENPFAWPELVEQGLPAWKVTELWVMAHHETSHVVDITERFDRKLAALRAHRSQTAHLGDRLEEMLRGWNGTNATRAGLPAGRLAEAFVVTRIN
ncbi:LmbE family N-acetylglucosaminyl deacetylase [Friedmanniella endophytica]|uniref:LmbE family N-acetylglucosaminyl deacetylase n=1 Tax=Microlunatus kandeliicorticis TaxID=1759536 RepID=A0A7W3IRK8_9ACTN|nr:PIG-L deacetylase family protein [Microlunatus kandeliicorticis]MBA8793885.1 LmbE family N-acetylglucosaminyl deacetylase [Microlunatus kandeliicorticis]